MAVEFWGYRGQGLGFEVCGLWNLRIRGDGSPPGLVGSGTKVEALGLGFRDYGLASAQVTLFRGGYAC